jgi:FtsP/CotA-like multicopper oxidase with cupredoxin domain
MNIRKSHFTIHALAVLALLLVPQAFAQSNTIQCVAGGGNVFYRDLVDIPLIPADDATGILRGTLYTVSEQVRMATPGPTADTPTCYPQWVRAYRRDAPASWNPPASQIGEPVPGPTLRTRVGGMIELTFLNLIDANKFPKADTGCEQTFKNGASQYPGTKVDPNPPTTPTGTLPDTYPDCFAGSVFTNVHYHGTHTNPNTTGDNVFLNIRPSPRKHDGTNAPEITADTVKAPFAEFFAACEAELKLNAGPKIWPRVWKDLTPNVQSALMDPVKPFTAWYESNLKLIENGDWPQYYVAAYPYCFKLPAATTSTSTTLITSATQTPHTHGAGTSEVDEAEAPSRPVLMGQAPGTHWYHAHKHGSTTINVSNGMTGVVVIEGQYDDDINKTYGPNWTRSSATKVLVINQLGSLPGLLTGTGGGPGPDFSVNGRLRPTIKMAGNSVQMWRIANTSSRAGAYFAAPSGLTWKQLAQDGVQFTPANYWNNTNRAFQLSSGNRADLLVKAPPYNAKSSNTYDVLVYNTIDPIDRPPAKPAVAPLTLLRVVVTANGADMNFLTQAQAPTFPDFLKDVADEEITGTKLIKFASSPTPPPTGGIFPVQHTIDGKKFDGEVGVVVALNHAEEWKVVNETYPPSTSNQISHPFHIHINPFQISEIFDPNAALSTKKGQGKVTIAAGTTNVVGAGTAFDQDFREGDFLWINAGSPAMPTATVVKVNSPTSMTINVKAPGSAAAPPAKPVTDAEYTVATALYTINESDARPGQCVLKAGKPETWKPCAPTEPESGRIWWDVFPIPSGNTFTSGGGTTSTNIPGYFKMRSRFVDYSGYYVIHCHILAHEDRGMMTVVEVAPVQTPYSHH